MVALVALSVVSAAGAANNGVKPVSNDALENVTPAFVPLGVSKAMTTYVVQLAGDPVVVADANSKDNGTGPLSDSQRGQLKDQLKAQQAPVAQQIQQLGGSVTASFQAAYNGLAVRIPADKASSLASIAGVTGVFRSLSYAPSNIHGIPLIGAPAAWGGTPGFTGTGTKIGDIDTGLDYTHADFGGPGTVAAWLQAKSMSTADPTLPTVCMTPMLTPCFGPNAPRVKGGVDLVGDSYNADPTSASYQPVPHPDPNPLDCNGHGTHTAGTAGGSGVLSNGHTFTGPYNATTVSGNSWNVGPGVAPQADLYSIRVFGCNGSVDDAVLIQAMEWAVTNHMDVINMSLGAPFGNATTPSAQAASNAAKDGVIVVSASGNNGPNPYMTSSPGSGAGTIAVAANDPTQSYPGAILTLTKANLTSGGTRTAIVANGFAPLPPGPFHIKVIYSAPGVISLGCSPAADGAPLPANTFIVVARGTCARVAKAIYGQQAGAAGVIMINNSSGYPPFEGKITSNPDNGMPFTVTIPFLGVQGAANPSASAAAAQFVAADGGTLTEAATTLANPGYLALASFSSAGPRSGDSALKPDVTAPGVSIASAGMGTGAEAIIESGTSMATPHTAGMAALVKQAHPDWQKVKYWNAAISNTANAGPTGVAGYNTLGAGSGLIQAFNATHTQVVALTKGGGEDNNNNDNENNNGNGNDDNSSGRGNGTSLSFGLVQTDTDFTGHQQIHLRNFGSTPATFNVADALDQGSTHTLTVDPSTVTVPAHGDANVDVALSVPVASAGDAYSFNSVAGLVTFTPASAGSNSGISLNVPYLQVPAASSDLQIDGVNNAHLKTGSATATLTNNHGAAFGVADWFAWGLKGKHSKTLGSDDLLSAGIQSFPTAPAPSGRGTGWLLFGIGVAHRWSNPAENEFDVLVDVNGDGIPDYDVIAIDLGALTTGSFNGQSAIAVAPLDASGNVAGAFSIRYLTGANFNGTTMELPVDFGQLCRAGFACISSTTPVAYTAVSFGLTDGTTDSFGATATYNLFHPVFSANYTPGAGDEDVVAPNTTATDSITVDKTQWALTPQLGLLALSQNNVTDNNRNEAFTFKADLK
jgi:minor extracellular serine protease Vpr